MHNDLVWVTDDLGPSRQATLDRLGGKGTALAEMAQDLDLPVPPAFVLTTDVCREYMQSGWPDGLNDRVREAMEELGSRFDRRFGDPGRPMLVALFCNPNQGDIFFDAGDDGHRPQRGHQP